MANVKKHEFIDGESSVKLDFALNVPTLCYWIAVLYEIIEATRWLADVMLRGRRRQ
jgi:hypothetical protein